MTDSERVIRRLNAQIRNAHREDNDFAYIPMGTAKKIVELLERLAPIEGVKWLRLLYAYPEGVTDELLDCMVKHENIVKYIDIPIQHFSSKVLHRMHRRDTRESVYETIGRIRAAHPDFAATGTSSAS